MNIIEMSMTIDEFIDLLDICDAMSERLKAVDNEVQSCYCPSCTELSDRYFLFRKNIMR